MTSETKEKAMKPFADERVEEFPLLTVMSILTGRAGLAPFDKTHELAEFVMGHSIWTHEFAERSLWDEMRKHILAQCPELVDFKAHGEITPKTVHSVQDAYNRAYPATFKLRSIQQPRQIASAKRFFPDKPIIPVIVKSSEGNGRNEKK